MSEQRNPVVASLATRSQHPYTSIAVSPDRTHAIAAGKDTLRVISVVPQGLKEIRSLRISQHFQSKAVSTAPRAQPRYRDVRDAFQKPPSPQNLVSSASTTLIYDVAWSLPQDADDPDSSVVAAAGSNGIVVLWNAKHAFLNSEATAAMGPPPDAVLSQHSRAVNRLAWHTSGRTPGYLLTASQDSTVKLWERRATSSSEKVDDPSPVISWFGRQSSKAKHREESISWHCAATFQPNAEAVRDVSWSPFHDDVFAMVTDSGSLIVYNIRVPATPWVRIQAHHGEATTVDWHPTRPYTVATGGAVDRCVKIWDLEAMMSLHSGRADRATNSWSLTSSVSDRSNDSGNDETNLRSATLSLGANHGIAHTLVSQTTGGASKLTSSSGPGQARQPRPRHTLNVAAAVTRISWRPPAGMFSPTDVHDSMIAVAMAPIKGPSSGGNGLLSLWSHHRPNMALSVVEGHKEGAVTDFAWLDIPVDDATVPKLKDKLMQDTNEPLREASSRLGTPVFPNEGSMRSRDQSTTPLMGSASRRRASDSWNTGGFSNSTRSRADHDDGKDKEGDVLLDHSSSLEGTWQHVLSVGRDGRCVIQSLARGDRPISRVPPSCFAMANLSPYQRGYGSLQIFSVHQSVPGGKQDDYALTGLRQDFATSRAPGVFREPMISTVRDGQTQDGQTTFFGKRLPDQPPHLVFNVIDQGDLDDELKPVEAQTTITVAPEVVHMSRFADSYKLYPDDEFPTRVSLCLHNASVAQELNCDSLARMWGMVAALLKGSGMDQLPPEGAKASNALQFALVPCVGKLLEDRANAGDVQTCVALCEILQVIQINSGEVTTCIPGLQIKFVREWYLSYIDLLQQMCLFSHATFVIGKCKDNVVGALNQQSTTIHEACPHCGKALLVGEGEDLQDRSTSILRRSCNSCRRRIGFCFLCHEPVAGVFVWCPGCGHGGHLDHALAWFGGRDGKPVRELCPTGCGHKCNISQQMNALSPEPSWASLKCLPVSEN